MVSVLLTVTELCMHADFCSTLNINVDFIRLFDCINCIEMFAARERALPRPPGESTRGDRRKEDWRRERWPGLGPQDLWQIADMRYALVIHSYHMFKPAESSFTEYVIHTVLSSSDSDLFVCYSVLPGNAHDAALPSVMSSVLSCR